MPINIQEIVTRYGGELKPTWGMPVEEIQRGIRHGLRKITIDTDCRLDMTGTIRKVFAEKPEEFDPRKYLGPTMAVVTKLDAQRFEEFGTAGNAPRIKPVSFANTARRYAKGSLKAA